MTHDADTCRVRPLDDDERRSTSPAMSAHRPDVRGSVTAARGQWRAVGERGWEDRLVSAVGDAARRASRFLRDVLGPAATRPIVASVGSDDLPPGPGGEDEPDPARNPGDLGDRIRRSGPSADRVFDDTDREPPSDRDFEGDDRPFGEGGPIPLPSPAEPGGI